MPKRYNVIKCTTKMKHSWHERETGLAQKLTQDTNNWNQSTRNRKMFPKILT